MWEREKEENPGDFRNPNNLLRFPIGFKGRLITSLIRKIVTITAVLFLTYVENYYFTGLFLKSVFIPSSSLYQFRNLLHQPFSTHTKKRAENRKKKWKPFSSFFWLFLLLNPPTLFSYQNQICSNIFFVIAFFFCFSLFLLY